MPRLTHIITFFAGFAIALILLGGRPEPEVIVKTERVGIPGPAVVTKGNTETVEICSGTKIIEVASETPTVRVPYIQRMTDVEVIAVKPDFTSCVSLLEGYFPDWVLDAEPENQERALRQYKKAVTGEQ